MTTTVLARSDLSSRIYINVKWDHLIDHDKNIIHSDIRDIYWIWEPSNVYTRSYLLCYLHQPPCCSCHQCDRQAGRDGDSNTGPYVIVILMLIFMLILRVILFWSPCWSSYWSWWWSSGWSLCWFSCPTSWWRLWWSSGWSLCPKFWWPLWWSSTPGWCSRDRTACWGVFSHVSSPNIGNLTIHTRVIIIKATMIILITVTTKITSRSNSPGFPCTTTRACCRSPGWKRPD